MTRPAATDGKRVLVERLWPRGVKKQSLTLDAWLKGAAPSGELRRWFAHDPAKWDEFRRRYFAELDRVPEVWRPLRDAAQQGNVTMLFSILDVTHNNAVALMDYLKGMGQAEPAVSGMVSAAPPAETRPNGAVAGD